jgi:hypothetical protein
MATVMTGIVKIPLYKVFIFPAVLTTQKLAHHFLSTLKHVDNVVNSGTELSTFNPFVVGSTPAGPTKKPKSTLYFDTKCFFHGRTRCEPGHPSKEPHDPRIEQPQCIEQTGVVRAVLWHSAQLASCAWPCRVGARCQPQGAARVGSSHHHGVPL